MATLPRNLISKLTTLFNDEMLTLKTPGAGDTTKSNNEKLMANINNMYILLRQLSQREKCFARTEEIKLCNQIKLELSRMYALVSAENK